MADAFASHDFRIVNVFTAGSAVSGNPLGVFEDARALDGKTLQGLALPLSTTVSQGSHVGRTSKLCLVVDASGSAQVAGDISTSKW